MFQLNSFETIRNNTALKPSGNGTVFVDSFETIRNNTALKLKQRFDFVKVRF